MKYLVIRDRIGRYVFIPPVITGLMDCSGFVRMAVRR